ncbi:MAG: dihydropteroate synthase [Muribaculaceae bacterium]|nr:dihydropteroate synthase [Muribaculaceae bacterium]
MKPFSLNLHGKVVEFDRPVVMAIVNATPDSFFSGSRTASAAEVERRVEMLLAEGTDIIDLGACSTRPGSESIDADEELRRLEMALEAVRRVSPTVPVSVDTFRASVARRCLTSLGADIINDISGAADPDMMTAVAELRAPYVLTHMRGTPATMQQLTDYSADGGVTASVLAFMAGRISAMADMGISDIMVDPGFGFAKTVEQNWELMGELTAMTILDRPLLVGISRKSMLTRPLDISPADALPATTAAHIIALQRGADILRVHDVDAARQAIGVWELSQNHTDCNHG